VLVRRICRAAEAGAAFLACQIAAKADEEARSLDLGCFQIRVTLREKNVAAAEQPFP